MTNLPRTPAVQGRGLPPGPRLPRTVQTLRWLFDGPRFMDECRERFGSLFTLDLHPLAVGGPGSHREPTKRVFVCDPEHIKQVFTAAPEAVLTGVTNMFLLPVVGPESILVLDEPRHLEERKLLLPPFHGERVLRYESLIREVTLREIARWPIGKPFAIWPRMQAITLEVIVRAIFGIGEPAQVTLFFSLLSRMLDEMTGAGFQIKAGLLAAFRNRGRANAVESRSAQRLVRSLDEALGAEIARRRACADFEEREDVLSALMSARDSTGTALGDRQLRDELVTLLIAGHESTATMLAWAFERLLRHPEKLDRLRDEIAKGGHTYADAVVKETLRLRPVLPIVLRALAIPMELDGYQLPAGTWIAPCAYLVNRDPKIYPAPRQFLPERFLEKPPGPYSWTPFGGGVRRCVGAAFAQLEMRVVLQTVLSRLDLRVQNASGERIGRRFITLAPARGGRVVLAGKLAERAHDAAADERPTVDHHEEQQLARQRDDRRAEHEHAQTHQN